jgi:hypothetical protein
MLPPAFALAAGKGLGLGKILGGIGKTVLGNLPLIGGLFSQQRNNAKAAQLSRYNTDQTIKAQKEMADLKWQRDKEMWNMQNAYNTPQAQMDRFEAAGLNRNLIYGQGSHGNSTQLPQYSDVKPEFNYKANQWITTLSQYQDFKFKQAQIDNVNAQTKQTNTITGLKAIESYVKENTKDIDIDRAKEDLKKTTAQRGYIGYQSDYQKKVNEYVREIQEQTLRGLKADNFWKENDYAQPNSIGVMGMDTINSLWQYLLTGGRETPKGEIRVRRR